MKLNVKIKYNKLKEKIIISYINFLYLFSRLFISKSVILLKYCSFFEKTLEKSRALFFLQYSELARKAQQLQLPISKVLYYKDLKNKSYVRRIVEPIEIKKENFFTKSEKAFNNLMLKYKQLKYVPRKLIHILFIIHINFVLILVRLSCYFSKLILSHATKVRFTFIPNYYLCFDSYFENINIFNNDLLLKGPDYTYLDSPDVALKMHVDMAHKEIYGDFLKNPKSFYYIENPKGTAEEVVVEKDLENEVVKSKKTISKKKSITKVTAKIKPSKSRATLVKSKSKKIVKFKGKK